MPAKRRPNKRQLPSDLQDFVVFETTKAEQQWAQPRKKPRGYTRLGRTREKELDVCFCPDAPCGEATEKILSEPSGSFFGVARSVALCPRTINKPCIGNRHFGRQRLALLLETYGLKERPVEGDGNCQFRALSDQLYGSEAYHLDIRLRVVEQLQACKDAYCGFVPGNFEAYVMKVGCDRTWGDHVTLQAAADAFGVEVNVLTDYLTEAFIKVSPDQRKTQKVLCLSFWAEVHYNSVV